MTKITSINASPGSSDTMGDVNKSTTKTPTRFNLNKYFFGKKKIAAMAIAILLIVGSLVVFLSQNPPSSDQESGLQTTPVENIQDNFPNNSDATVSKSTSIKDLIQGKTKVGIGVTAKYQKDQPSIQDIKSVNLPKEKRSMLPFVKSVLAQDLQSSTTIDVPRVIFQQMSDDHAKSIADKFGFSDDPTKPDQDPRVLLWEQPGKRLFIDSYTIEFNQYQEGGPLPSFEEAKQVAIDYLKSLDFLPQEYDVYNVFPEADDTNIFYRSFEKNNPQYNTFVKAVSVGFVSKYKSIPISSGDISAKFYQNEINAFPQVYVWVGSQGKIVSVQVAKSFSLSSGGNFPLKNREAALADLKATGGVFMNSQYLESQKSGSYCYGKKCTVQNAVINDSKLVYYQISSLSRQYNDDELPHDVGYAVPMWLFGGEGDMVRTVDGESTYNTKIKFISGIYAISDNGEQNLFRINSLKSENYDDKNFRVVFDFSFNVSSFFGNYRPNPRQGLDYTLLVLYPDNTYGEYRSVIYDANGREELIIPTRGVSGNIKAILYLTDFPRVLEISNINSSTKTGINGSYKNAKFKYEIYYPQYPQPWIVQPNYNDSEVKFTIPGLDSQVEYLYIYALTKYPNLSNDFTRSTIKTNSQDADVFTGPGFQQGQSLVDYLIKGEGDNYFTIQGYYKNENTALRQIFDNTVKSFLFPAK